MQKEKVAVDDQRNEIVRASAVIKTDALTIAISNDISDILLSKILQEVCHAWGCYWYPPCSFGLRNRRFKKRNWWTGHDHWWKFRSIGAWGVPIYRNIQSFMINTSRIHLKKELCFSSAENVPIVWWGLWMGTGFLLLYKRFEDGRMCWPQMPQEATELTEDHFKYRMLGLNPLDPKIKCFCRGKM